MNSPKFVAPSISAVAWLSMLSGTLMVAFPRRMAHVYGLPASDLLVTMLGSRDILIGTLIAVRATRVFGLANRAIADVYDARLIREEARRRERTPGAGRSLLALTAATYAILLGVHTSVAGTAQKPVASSDSQRGDQ